MSKTETKPIKVAIVDDHEAIRLGFAGACLEYGYELIAHAPSVDELIQKLKKKFWNLVLGGENKMQSNIKSQCNLQICLTT